MAKETKTNAMRMLERQKVPYQALLMNAMILLMVSIVQI